MRRGKARTEDTVVTGLCNGVAFGQFQSSRPKSNPFSPQPPLICINPCPFTVHRSPFTRSPFTRSPFTRSPFTRSRSPFTVRRSPFAERALPKPVPSPSCPLRYYPIKILFSREDFPEDSFGSLKNRHRGRPCARMAWLGLMRSCALSIGPAFIPPESGETCGPFL
jgi:hypothetical protein